MRENLNVWLLDNQWWTRFTWDTRDLVYNPTTGVYASEILTLGGGILGGNTHFSRTDTKTEAYVKLLSFPVTDNYLFQLVFKARTAFSFLGPSLGGLERSRRAANGRALISTACSYGRWLGLPDRRQIQLGLGHRAAHAPVPYAEKILWIDAWIDQNILVDIDTSPSLSNPFTRPLTDQKLAWGAGLRIVNPQFPIAIYLLQSPSSSTVTMDASFGPPATGSSGPSIDMKLVVSFAMEY